MSDPATEEAIWSFKARGKLEARVRKLEQTLADLNIENLIRVAKEAEERGEQRIPCFLQVEWVARAAEALGFQTDASDEQVKAPGTSP